MSPMLNSKYFQPMQHRPLPDIRKYALLTNQKSEFYAIIKPEGVDVFINDGKIYDFRGNALQNQYLQFHFEKLLKTSIDMKMTIVGTLVSPNGSLSIRKYRHTLYGKTKSTFTDAKFVVYDVVFPVFNVDHVYKLRYDIADKVVGILPNCATASKVIVKDGFGLQKIVTELFSIDTGSSIIVYKSNGSFVPGPSQLYYGDEDTVSYIVEATQRYRGHIKKVVSTTLRMDNEERIEVALYIITKFKKEFVNVPVNQTNLVLRRFIWEKRKELKNHPFWYTGYTLPDERSTTGGYITPINEFLSFIPPTDGDEIR